MIISKKRFNEAIAKAVEEVHKQNYIENELRELRRMMFDDMDRLRNDMRRMEAKMNEPIQIYSEDRSIRPIPHDRQS